MPRWPTDPAEKARRDFRRLVAKFTVDEGCWLWRRPISNNGYAYIKWDGRDQPAHRVIYELLVGPIPDGLVIDHLCRVRHCLNPGHMEPVTGAENTRRGRSGQLQAERTHCPRGHPYNEENTYYERSQRHGRACRACHRMWYHQRKATKDGNAQSV